MSRTLLLLCILAFQAASICAQDGALQNSMVKIRSANSVVLTSSKLEAAIQEKGLRLFGAYNHSENAEKSGLSLKPTKVVVFGNPKMGTPLMNCAPTVAIDLPQKVLIFEDKEGQVWLIYNNPDYLVQRHQIGDECMPIINKLKGALASLAAAAVAP